MQSDNLTVAHKATSDLLDRAGVGAMAEAKIRQSFRSDDGPTNNIYIGFLNALKGADGQPAAPVVTASTVVWCGQDNYGNYLKACDANKRARTGDDDEAGDVIDATGEPTA